MNLAQRQSDAWDASHGVDGDDQAGWKCVTSGVSGVKRVNGVSAAIKARCHLHRRVDQCQMVVAFVVIDGGDDRQRVLQQHAGADQRRHKLVAV